MITLKIKIDSSDDSFIEKKQMNYSYAFRKLYNYKGIPTKEFLKVLLLKYNLSQWEINGLNTDVDTKKKHCEIQIKKDKKKIIYIEEDIEKLKNKKYTIPNKRKIFKLKKTLKRLKTNLNKDIVFGSKSFLSNISKAHNKNDFEKAFKLKEEYETKRIIPILYLGSLNDLNSNRYFNFDFENQSIVYKPNRNTKIELKYKTISKKYQKQLLRLQEIKDLKFLPITVRLSTNFIYITYDNEKLNGFAFKEKEYYKERKGLTNKTEIKYISQKYCKEQTHRKIEGKNKDRYLQIDENPVYIGYSITEKINENGEFKILETGCFGLEQLSKKNNKSSNDKETLYLNNKRKYELSLIYKSIFKKIKHYNCGTIVTEDLNFKPKNLKDGNKEFNRKTKNIWLLSFRQNLIQKYCNEQGVVWEKVNPSYTSVIGNMKYSYFDPINASLEIGRRGMFKYNKGFKYQPNIDSTLLDAMSNRFATMRDVLTEKSVEISWYELLKKFKETKTIYRWSLSDCKPFKLFSKDHIKSKVNLYSF
jgi:IS605 OrfB family transposase